MTILPATIIDIPVIHRLAQAIWWPTYRGFISSDQITFMLAEMYSLKALEQQFKEGIDFLMVENDNEYVGFASYSSIEPENNIFKLHKLYILPSEQGKGTGKKLIDYIANLSKQKGGEVLELNVNRSNPAFSFYKTTGFEIYQTIDIPYHHFVLNDYVMRKVL